MRKRRGPKTQNCIKTEFGGGGAPGKYFRTWAGSIGSSSWWPLFSMCCARHTAQRRHSRRRTGRTWDCSAEEAAPQRARHEAAGGA